MHTAARTAALAIAVAALAWLAVVALLWFAQERLLFQPEPLAPGHRFDAGADVHERFIEVPGARLSVLELRRPDPAGVVFFLHGNAGNLASWFVDVDFYRRENLDLVMPDYRGYGKSTGRITSEAQLHADVAAVWHEFAPRYRGKRIVFYGRSLGTGLAATLAAAEQPDLTVLVSPYRSMAALAREHYPWVPAPVLRYPLATEAVIGAIRGPVLLIHGSTDALIPPTHSADLLPLAKAGRRVVIAGAGHNDLQAYPAYRAAVSEALAALGR